MSLKLDLKQYQLENNSEDLDLAQKYRRGLFHILAPYILALMTFLSISSLPYLTEPLDPYKVSKTVQKEIQ